MTRGLGRDLLREGDTSLLVMDVGRGLFVAFLKVPPNTQPHSSQDPRPPMASSGSEGAPYTQACRLPAEGGVQIHLPKAGHTGPGLTTKRPQVSCSH